MPLVVVAPEARRALDALIVKQQLPPDTWRRVRRPLEPLASFPLLGRPLSGAWAGGRCILGPWRWMIIVYKYDEDRGTVAVLTIQDGRTSKAATIE